MSLNNRTISPAAIAKIKGFEGLRLTAYQDIIGIWSIAYGHTGRGIVRGVTITEAQADAYLHADLASCEHFVNNACTVPLTQGQFDALVDFAFNCGIHNLADSTLLKLVNESKFAEASAEFVKWDHAGHREVEALKHRRIMESVTFDIEAAIDYDWDAEFEIWCEAQEERYRYELAMFTRPVDDDELGGYIKHLEESHV